jgi:hypothetical protein
MTKATVGSAVDMEGEGENDDGNGKCSAEAIPPRKKLDVRCLMEAMTNKEAVFVGRGVREKGQIPKLGVALNTSIHF